jgi:hypothetical protein
MSRDVTSAQRHTAKRRSWPRLESGQGYARQPGLPQPGAQIIPEGDEGDDGHGDRYEHTCQRLGEIADDGAGPGRVAQRGGLDANPGDAVGARLFGHA